MEEPQVTTDINDGTVEDTKIGSNNDGEIDVGEEESTKPMDIDNDSASILHETSPMDVSILGESSTNVHVDEIVPNDILEESAGQSSPNIADESSAQHNADTTEKSINISQLNMDLHADESSDAFDALKRDENDALNSTHEEIEEHRKKSSSNDREMEKDNDSDTQTSQTREPVKSVESKDAETQDDEMMGQDTQAESPRMDAGDDHTADDAFDSMRADPEPELETEEIEPEPEETNGEGVDEDVQLLGDEDENIESDKVDGENVENRPEESGEVIEIGSDMEDDHEDEITVPVEMEDETPEEEVLLKENEIREFSGEEQACLNCENTTMCTYKVLEESGEIRYLCSYNCVNEHREDNPDKYALSSQKIPIIGIQPVEEICNQCNESKLCNYSVNISTTSSVNEENNEEATPKVVQSVETKFICSQDCVKSFIGDDAEKYAVKELRKTETRKLKDENEIPKITARSDAEKELAMCDREESLIRRCGGCLNELIIDLRSIHWQAMYFCNKNCLSSCQNLIASACGKCNQVVDPKSIGKLCCRFGNSILQFCSMDCFKEYKTSFQPCTVCSTNLKRSDGVVQIFKKGTNRFCSRRCVRRYDEILNRRQNFPARNCAVCSENKVPTIFMYLDASLLHLCSEPCLSAFRFVNNIEPDECHMCHRFFERKSLNAFTYFEFNNQDAPKMFCTNECYSVFLVSKRKTLQCDWCKCTKYSIDLIHLQAGKLKMCSIACLNDSETPKSSKSSSSIRSCSNCFAKKKQQYSMEMSDSTSRQFCTYQCVLSFQSKISKAKSSGEIIDVVPKGVAKRITESSLSAALAKSITQNQTQWAVPVRKYSTPGRRGRPSKHSGPYNPTLNRSFDIPVPELSVQMEKLIDVPSRVKVKTVGDSMTWEAMPPSPPTVVYEHKTQVVTIPSLPKEIRNKSTMCKSLTLNKAISCIPDTTDAECQTEEWLEQRFVVPIPIPIFVPQPMYMYSLPTPIPVPFPLPIPVPIFIPTTRNSAPGIMKEIKKIQDKMPTDPYEAELLMMAEMVAGESKKREETDSDSDDNVNDMEYNDAMVHNSSFNEDLVQMAFKMASGDHYDEHPVDLENQMTANTIASSPYGSDLDHHSLHQHQLMLLQQQRDQVGMQSARGRKRMPPSKPVTRNSAGNKRIKRESEIIPEIQNEPTEKPDAHLCLKYTFGVNAWKQWVTTKNADLEKSSLRRKPIKSEILQLTADELNYSLCMFVKEVRKPNGSEYAPDTIYYLVLGIQQYLYENGRIDNIFTDRYYESFTTCLDEVAKKFSVLYNDSQYIVTRVEEEHLWECKQLGAHSPHVLLSTLMFFNTKHFNLVTSDEHMELSFSHIMKHWKRNPNSPGAAKTPGSRNVLLRFYPPQTSLANSRKKKVYEQQENEDNPLRCPVKLYEFFLSKCPESVKTRNDVFYLQPERSCVPDSPVWYSTQALSRESLSKMLHRVKMVKEINIALLTS